jgi:hypothetical protein
MEDAREQTRIDQRSIYDRYVCLRRHALAFKVSIVFPLSTRQVAVPLSARASRMAGWYMNLYCFANHLDKQRTCIRSTMASSLRHYIEDKIFSLEDVALEKGINNRRQYSIGARLT